MCEQYMQKCSLCIVFVLFLPKYLQAKTCILLKSIRKGFVVNFKDKTLESGQEIISNYASKQVNRCCKHQFTGPFKKVLAITFIIIIIIKTHARPRLATLKHGFSFFLSLSLCIYSHIRADKKHCRICLWLT